MRDDIDHFVAELASRTLERTGMDIGYLLACSVGRVLRIEAAKGASLFGPNDHSQDDYNHIRDWLVAAVQRGEPWLRRLDGNGVPVKLAKFGTFGQIVDEANKAMRRINTSGGPRVKSEGETVHSFENGYRIVRLRKAAELDAESAAMQHCLGHGAYDELVSLGSIGIFSLRDRNGKSHATIEVDMGGMFVEQVKGKQNRVPRRDYFGMVAEWLTLMDYAFQCDDHPPTFAVDQDKRLVDLEGLRPGAVFNGDIRIDLVTDTGDGQLSLPEGLTVTGRLSVKGRGDQTLKLPAGLSVGERLAIQGMTVDSDCLPGAAIDMSECRIERIPAVVDAIASFDNCVFSHRMLERRTKFQRNVFMTGCVQTDLSRILANMDFGADATFSSIRALVIPGGTDIRGELRVNWCGLAIKGDLRVGTEMVVNVSQVDAWHGSTEIGGSFLGHRSVIQCLPPSMKVAGGFRMGSVDGIEILPAGIEIGGEVLIDDCDIRSLDGRKVFHGDLCLKRCAVEGLEDGTSVGGDLILNNLRSMTRLPEYMTVEGNAEVSGHSVKYVPGTLRTGGKLVLSRSMVTATGEGLTVGGDLVIEGQLEFTLGADTAVGGSLRAGSSGLRAIPDGFQATAILAHRAKIASLPDGLTLDGTLDLGHCPLESLPRGLRVGGYIVLNGTAVDEIPGDTVAGGILTEDDSVVARRQADTALKLG